MSKNRVWIQLAGAGLMLSLTNACVETGGASDEHETGEGDGDGDPGDGDGDPGDGDGDSGDDVEQACTATCEIYEQCLGPIPDCVSWCIDYTLGFDDQCIELELELLGCLAGLTCEELMKFYEQEDESAQCLAEADASCGGGCGEVIFGGADPGVCSVSTSCEGQTEYSVDCDGQICTCYVDGEPTGTTCPTSVVCDEPSVETYAACCE